MQKIARYLNPYPARPMSNYGAFAVATKRSSLFEWIALFFGHANCGECVKWQGALWLFGTTFMSAGLFGVAGLVAMALFWVAVAVFFRWRIQSKWEATGTAVHKVYVDPDQVTHAGAEQIESQLNALMVDGPKIKIAMVPQQQESIENMAFGFGVGS